MILALLVLLAQQLAPGAGTAPADPAAAGEGTASAAPDGAAILAALHAVRADGAVKLPAEAQRDVVSLLPAQRRGEECPEAARVTGDAQALKDRGEGAVIVLEIASCKGARVFAFAPGTPVRVARLFDVGDAQPVRSVKAVNLRGTRRDDDLAVEVFTSATASELRLFTRRDTGFAFSEAGALREFAQVRECAAGGEEDGSGWTSALRPGKGGLDVLRLDAACSGATWQASCLTWRLDRDALARRGVCALPRSLDARALKASGWR